MNPYRRDEDSPQKNQKHVWDYWFFPNVYPIEDAQVAEQFPGENEDLLANSSYVKNLPAAYETTGVILEEVGWLDIQDHGWRLLKQPSRSNSQAEKSWSKQLRQLIEEHPEKICIQIITHC